jgi:hypothetical protein
MARGSAVTHSTTAGPRPHAFIGDLESVDLARLLARLRNPFDRASFAQAPVEPGAANRAPPLHVISSERERPVPTSAPDNEQAYR